MNGVAQSNQVCPECAAPRAERTPPTPWLVRHRRLVQLATLLTAIAWIVWRNWLAWPVLPVPLVYPAGGAMPEFPAHRFTRGDVERYASGEIADGRLLGDLYTADLQRPEVLRHWVLAVTFVPASGARWEFRRYGWPSAFVIYRYSALYDDVYDVYTRMSPSPIGRPPPQKWWRDWVYVAERIDEHGRRETFVINTRALAEPLLVLIAMWGVGRVLRWFVFVVGLASVGGSRLRDRLGRNMPFAVAALASLIMIGASIRQRIDPGESFPIPQTLISAGARTILTLADIDELGEQVSGEASLARAILDATVATPRDSRDCLVFGWASTFDTTFADAGGGWPKGLLGLDVTEVLGRESSDRTIRRVSTPEGSLKVVVRRSNPRYALANYWLSRSRAALLVLGLCVVWVGAGLIVGVVR
ncbi:MAG: hypothetical protein IID31_09485, partial [Planctomycetes bacterium]|nr:hypothetical protein [Planctomycetota bacterium]